MADQTSSPRPPERTLDKLKALRGDFETETIGEAWATLESNVIAITDYALRLAAAAESTIDDAHLFLSGDSGQTYIKALRAALDAPIEGLTDV